jgi:hypothetical protein
MKDTRKKGKLFRMNLVAPGIRRMRRRFGRDNTSMLAEVVNIHGYLKTPADLAKYSGSPLVRLNIGKGKVLASEMMLLEASQDPIAERLLGNLIKTLSVDD